MAPRTSSILIPPSFDSFDPQQHTLRRPVVPGLPRHVGRLGLHHAQDDPRVHALPKADRFEAHLLILLRTYTYIFGYSSDEIVGWEAYGA